VRLNEFASAQDQIALWRLVSDSVWASISQQAEQERKQRAEKAAQSKYKGTRGKKSSKVAKPAAPISSPTTPPIINKPMLSKKPLPAAHTNPQAAKMQQAVPSTHAVKQPTAQPVQQFSKAVAASVQPTAPNTVQNPSSVSKPAVNAPTMAVVAQPIADRDRHSANGLRAQPVQPARTTARGAITR
jgi:hypothetical protein